jgi:stage III sporulation protein AB
MKLIACLLIIALCSYIGRLFAKRAAQRLDFFREYQTAIISLSGRIAGTNLELCKALESSCGSSLRVFFGDCSNLLKESPQSRFSAIWKHCFEKIKPTSLTVEDLKIVYSGGEAIEALCMNPCEKQADIYIRRISGYLDGLETEKQKKCRIYNTTGVLTGLLIALLMI